MEQNFNDVQVSYDQVAEEYASHFTEELGHKPLDRALLNRFAEEVRGAGRVYDLGCGPGHIARYLSDHGLSVAGIDLSSQMIEAARRLNPGIEFRQGNIASLPVEDESLAGMVAFYSLIHFQEPQLFSVFQELFRVLQPNGLLFLSFHEGQEVRHLEDFLGKSVSLNFYFFERANMERYLKEVGFEIEESLTRSPYSGEVETQRSYIMARKTR
ncbi:MAG TPA: methyltransferase domain-containing protein [Ktedonobacteraceae bacterium]|nr:methyltransferase domain-containing protein [Ktedonobacteraceae bacterium]